MSTLAEPLAVSAMTTIAVASEGDAAAWDAFVTSHPRANGYHLWTWRRVFTGAFNHEPIYLIARHGTEIAGVLPLVYINSAVFGRSLTSLPFLNYGGVVATSDDVAMALVEKAGAIARARRCRHVELRHVARRFPSLPFRQHKVVMLLSLESGIWDRLDRKVRNQVRKAQKSGLVAQHGGPELVADFYTVFAHNMRDLGTPVYSRRLFEQVLAAFPAQTRIHVVRLNGQPVAAGLTYRSRTSVEVPWASSVREFNNLCPNHLLYWHIIETALEDGTAVLDYGRSTPGEGTFKFKEQWGAQPVPLHWEYYLCEGTELPHVGTTNPKFQLAIELWKRLPLGVATRLGPGIVKGIP